MNKFKPVSKGSPQSPTRYPPVKNEKSDSPTLLLVEDVEETRDCIEKLLEGDGYRVAVARDEESALESVRHNHPDLIMVCTEQVMDDNVAIGRRIRTHAELSDNIPVVVFCCETVSEGEKISVGDNVYVVCPDNFNQLRRFLIRLLSRPALVV